MQLSEKRIRIFKLSQNRFLRNVRHSTVSGTIKIKLKKEMPESKGKKDLKQYYN